MLSSLECNPPGTPSYLTNQQYCSPLGWDKQCGCPLKVWGLLLCRLVLPVVRTAFSFQEDICL